MAHEWSFERLLAAGRAVPRLFPLGADALELMSEHLARVAERARADGRRREAAGRAASLALDWLASAVALGLLADCPEARVAATEEEWACIETEFAPDPP
jgi:hypothetical protein